MVGRIQRWRRGSRLVVPLWGRRDEESADHPLGTQSPERAVESTARAGELLSKMPSVGGRSREGSLAHNKAAHAGVPATNRSNASRLRRSRSPSRITPGNPPDRACVYMRARLTPRRISAPSCIVYVRGEIGPGTGAHPAPIHPAPGSVFPPPLPLCCFMRSHSFELLSFVVSHACQGMKEGDWWTCLEYFSSKLYA